ncbi:MAG: hypothetical protein KME30_32465 [Iphinoe sp. HA4291-MV1]|jgi:hypothetical protein|nr:hypothetical protein [Iphinoe sp. HA4291-MV1]
MEAGKAILLFQIVPISYYLPVYLLPLPVRSPMSGTWLLLRFGTVVL